MVTTATTGLAACLAALARGRDAAAWGWLIDQAGADMARVAGRLAGDAALASDAVHEALLRIRDDAGDFTVRSADADGDAWGWIMRVTANAALQLLRRQRRERERDRHAYVPQPSHPPAPDAALEHGEHATLVRRELAELPEPTRAAIVLHVMEGLGYDRVATELRIPVGTAKTRVRRGLETLRRRLTKAGCVLSLGALGTALQQLPAASFPIASITLLPLLTTTQASTIGAISAGGLAMSVKIAIGIAAVLAIAAVPIMSSQDDGTAPIGKTSHDKGPIEKAPPADGFARYSITYPRTAKTWPKQAGDEIDMEDLKGLSLTASGKAIVDQALLSEDGKYVYLQLRAREKIRTTPPGQEPSVKPDPLPTLVRGVVAAVRNNPEGEQDLVVLTISEKAQVQVGVEFIIFRGNQYIVKARIERVEKDTAFARVIPEFWNTNKLPIQPGDIAQNRF